MAEYNKSAGGAWIDVDKVKDGDKVKIVSEVQRQESKFKNPDGSSKTENIGKVRLQGAETSVNMRFNWATIYALIDAFGTDSKAWANQVLTAKTVDAMVGDTMRTILYLIPEGFELVKNEEKKLVIQKKNATPASATSEQTGTEISPDDIPF